MKPWIGRESGLVKPSHSISKFCQELAQVWILDFGFGSESKIQHSATGWKELRRLDLTQEPQS